jgi:hypothetical protein
MIRLHTGSTGFHVVLNMFHVWRCVFCCDDVHWIRAVGLLSHVGVVVVVLVEVNLSSRYQVHSPKMLAVVLLP